MSASPTTENRIVLITRRTRLQDLVVRFNTIAQAQFYVEHAGADFSDYLQEDKTYATALRRVTAALRELGRLHVLDRTFLSNYVFGAQDVIVTLGQDGLVANTLKYLDGQPVVGVNPDPQRWDGPLLPFRVNALAKVMPEVCARRRKFHEVTLAEARLNDGQHLLAVNDLFIGIRGHGSARYVLRAGEASERHSSCGVIVSTGLGSTGWLKSLLNGAAAVALSLSGERSREKPRQTPSLLVKTDFAWDSQHLCFTVREPFPSKTTGASLVHGQVTRDQPLIIESLMAEGGIIFSDGMENDFLNFNSGAQATITLAEKRGCLVA
jgi:NAD kinase